MKHIILITLALACLGGCHSPQPGTSAQDQKDAIEFQRQLQEGIKKEQNTLFPANEKYNPKSWNIPDNPVPTKKPKK